MAFDYASLISAGLNFAGNAITNQINAERASSDMATYLNLVKKQRDWQNEDKDWSERYSKNLMDYQYDNFSSPSAQIQAYRKAGINPFLASQGGDVGSGQSVSPSAAPQSQRGSVSPFLRPELGNVMQGTADKLFNASTVKSQRIAALAEFSKSLPDLVKSVGKDGARRVASAYLGEDIDMNRIDSMIQNEAMQQLYNTKISEIESILKQKYGDKQTSNILALQEQEFNKMAAEVRLMASEGRLNDANIEKLASDYIRNLADALKLKKEGDYFIASASQAAAMSDLVTLQGKKLSFENRESGYYEGSGLDNYLKGKYHSDKTADMRRIFENAEGSELVKALDRVLGKYLKLSSGM